MLQTFMFGLTTLLFMIWMGFGKEIKELMSAKAEQMKNNNKNCDGECKEPETKKEEE